VWSTMLKIPNGPRDQHTRDRRLNISPQGVRVGRPAGWKKFDLLLGTRVPTKKSAARPERLCLTEAITVGLPAKHAMLG